MSDLTRWLRQLNLHNCLSWSPSSAPPAIFNCCHRAAITIRQLCLENSEISILNRRSTTFPRTRALQRIAKTQSLLCSKLLSWEPRHPGPTSASSPLHDILRPKQLGDISTRPTTRSTLLQIFLLTSLLTLLVSLLNDLSDPTPLRTALRHATYLATGRGVQRGTNAPPNHCLHGPSGLTRITVPLASR